MSSWRGRITEHPAWASIENTQARLQEIDEPQDPVHLEELTRMRQMIGLLKGLESVEPELLTSHFLNQIHTVLTKANTNLDGPTSTGSKQSPQLAAASLELEKAFQSGWALPLRDIVGTDAAALSGAYRATLEKAISRGEDQRKSIEDNLSRLNEELKDALSRVDALKSEADSKRDEAVGALRAEITELESTLADQKSRLDAAIAQFQEQFSAAQEEKRKDFASLVEEVKGSAAQVLEKLQADVGSQVSKAEDEAAAHLARMGQLRAQAEDLLQVITREGLVAGYQAEADDERTAANLWRWIAVASLSSALVLAFIFLRQSIDAGVLDVGRYFSRLTVASFVIALAGYAARQSLSHRRRERYARDIQLELASLGPYLESLPEEARHEVKVRMVFRMFGRRGAGGEDEADGDVSIIEALRRRGSGSQEGQEEGA